MEHIDEAVAAAADTKVSQEVLEEMVWFFRVEDASPWNYSMLALAALVVVISTFLLVRNIRAHSRQGKRQPRDKGAPEVLQLDDSGAKPKSSLHDLRETLILEKSNLVPVGTCEVEERDVALALLPEASESES